MIASAVIKPLITRIWCQILTRIRGTSSGGASQEISTTRSPLAATPPLEVVEIIAAHLTYDTPSLLACALTCFSWYIAAIPHLHHTFATEKYSHTRNPDWPNPLQHTRVVGSIPLDVIEMIVSYLIHDLRSLRTCTLICYSWYIVTVPHLHHTLTIKTYYHIRRFAWSDVFQHTHALGLLPLVKRLRVRGKHDHTGLSPTLFNSHLLRQFFTLSNVRELEVEYLDIPNFMPRIRQYFRNFLPTVRYLSLREPKGSHRQIIYFIGLFRHLQDLRLMTIGADLCQETADDQAPIPLFIPPLRGHLVMAFLTEMSFIEKMIDLLGRIRFYHMNLFEVDGMRLLLDSCAGALECLVFSPTDRRSE